MYSVCGHIYIHTSYFVVRSPTMQWSTEAPSAYASMLYILAEKLEVLDGSLFLLSAISRWSGPPRSLLIYFSHFSL